MTASPTMQVLHGLPVSGGIAIGRAVCISSRTVEVFRLPLSPGLEEQELARFRTAVTQAQEIIDATRRKAGQFFGRELAAIFDAHSLLLSDPSLVGQIEQRIVEDHVNAEWAVHRAAEELRSRFAQLENSYLRERVQDVEDVSRQLLRCLQGIAHHELSEVDGDVVLVADDLKPSDAIRLGRKVVGFASESGGLTSHTSIIARSLNLPAVAGLPGVSQLVTDADPVVLDGRQGTFVLHPTPEVLADYRRQRDELLRRADESETNRNLAAVTRDGVAVDLMANIDLPEEIAEVARFGACGIGLYRSEFLYMETDPRLPSEEEHLEIYSRLARAAAPHPVVIRTYDLGGRKLAREMMDTREENPVLGLRGIRLTLARPQIFHTQLRAALRAGVVGNLWLMIPMVSGIEEVRQFRAVVADLTAELDREGIEYGHDFKLGVMIEVPAAAAIADLLAREVDFFSIGTNDLIQYSLAVDRNNEHVAYLYQPLHPAILRMLRFVIRSAQEAGIEVSLCGEMGSDPRYLPLLLGLGLRRLSINPRSVPAIKELVRSFDSRQLATIAERCLEQRSAAEVAALLAASGLADATR